MLKWDLSQETGELSILVHTLLQVRKDLLELYPKLARSRWSMHNQPHGFLKLRRDQAR
jgi:hypothetical protein